VEALDVAVLPRAVRRILAPVQLQPARQGVEFVLELRTAADLHGVDAEGRQAAQVAQETRGGVGVQAPLDAGEDIAAVNVDGSELVAPAGQVLHVHLHMAGSLRARRRPARRAPRAG
jgi:formamidopyrimidine-DNA glycosylase